MSAWYLAHENELLIDIDEYTRPTKDGAPWGEIFFRRRLREAIKAGKLSVQSVWLLRSSSPRHFQIFLRLRHRLDVFERLTWQLHLGSDLYRGRADLMRACRGFTSPSLLIRPSQIDGFYRLPDDVCNCRVKHRTDDPATHCSTYRHYRGMSPWELFGPSSTDREQFVALPEGEVPITKILKKTLDRP